MTTAGLAIGERRGLTKWLALTGIVGLALFVLSGLWEMSLLAANDTQLFDPAQYRLQDIAFVLAFVVWLATAVAFYLRGAAGRGWLGKIAIPVAPA